MVMILMEKTIQGKCTLLLEVFIFVKGMVFLKKRKLPSKPFVSRSVMSDSATPAHQTPLSMGILQARTLEWVAMPFCISLLVVVNFQLTQKSN